jgi:hypothetical protein
MSSKPRRGPSLRDIVGEDIRVVEPRVAVIEQPQQTPAPIRTEESGHEPRRQPSSTPEPARGQGTLKQRAHQFSTYLEPPVYDALRDIAHAERVKIHALLLEGVDLVLKKRGMPSVEKLMSSGHDRMKG